MEKAKTKSDRRRVIILSSVVVIIALTVLYLSISVFFQYHFFKDTYIGGMDCSYMTPSAVEEAFMDVARTYYLEITERGGSVEHVTAEDIGLSNSSGISSDELHKLLDEQNSYAWLFHGSSSYDLKQSAASYDEALLTARFNTLKCLDSESMKPAAPPDISFADGAYTIGRSDPGTMLDTEKTKQLIKKAIDNMQPKLSLEESGCYLNSAGDNEKAYTDVLNSLNRYAGVKLTLTFRDELEPVVIDSTQISKWMSVDEKLQIVFDMEAIESFVAEISKNIETMGQTRRFTNSYGSEINISGGDYGWWVSEGKEAENIVADIKSGNDVTREMTYLQTAASFGESDIGDTYIEINLMKQHLFCYKDGKLLTECDIISGTNAAPTPSGVYRMRFMFKNYTFNRSYFNKTVAYWMVFYGNDADSNIGLISCDWRSDFGGTTYLYNGTHGSVFIPMAAAAAIYKEIPNDIPVIIYKTP